MSNYNYLLEIYRAAGDDRLLTIANSLIKKLNDLYRFFEPTHFRGRLLVFQALDNKDIVPNARKTKHITNNFLLNPKSEQIIIQVLDDDTVELIEDLDSTDEIFNSKEVVIYSYSQSYECFFAHNKKIEIPRVNNAGSMFAGWFAELCEAFDHYMYHFVLHTSSCPSLKKIWFDKNKIFLRGGGKNLPEKYIQESLEVFLKARLRGVSVVREYNNGGSKPVDIRVSWGEAHRSALIEIKWLGKSCNSSGKISTQYSSSRLREGAAQLKEYLDLAASDTPEIITKGYLIALDGRRKGTSEKTVDINREKGCFYQYIDESEQYKDYLKNIFNFERPYIMFAMPIVSSTC